MEPDIKPAQPRKVKYQPKAPPRRVSKPAAVVKTEVKEDSDATKAKEMLRRFNENLLKGRPKVEKKSDHARVAFGYGGSSASIKSYGNPKNKYQSPTSSAALAGGLREGKEYKEPWDYYSYYPVTLPMRRPYSGNPAILDEEEFREDSESLAYNEDSTKPAIALDLTEESEEPSLFFLQLPATMPSIKRSATADSTNEITSNSKPRKGAGPSEKTCSLDDLPAGLMGKMLVYSSGAIKMKLGDMLYDVSPGLDFVFAQDAVAVNTEKKQCCTVGELSKRAIITPAVDSVLDNMDDLVM